MARWRPAFTPVFSASIVVLLLVAASGAALAQTRLPAPPAATSRSKHQSNNQTNKPSKNQSNGQATTQAQKQQCPPFPGANGFVRSIDNRLMPLVPGTTFTYRETIDGSKTQNDVVEVTNGTQVIMGVRTVVVHDTVKLPNGDLVEKTTDWYAQDKKGNVWYFGEDTAEYKNGKVVSREGSWRAGVKGAEPGIVMEAHPKAGDTYRQECAAAQKAADTAKVLKLSTSVTVPFGSFDHALLTQETSKFDPGVVERKQYAPCVGFVRSEIVKGGKEVAELVDVKGPAGGSGSGCNPSSSGQASTTSKSKPTARSQSSGSGGGAKAPGKGGRHGSSGGGSGSGAKGGRHGHHSSAASGSGGGAGGRSSARHHHRGGGGRGGQGQPNGHPQTGR